MKVDENGERAPAGEHFERQRRRGMLIAGIALFGGGYVGGVGWGLLMTLINNTQTDYYSFIPLGGPLIRAVILGSRYGNFGEVLVGVALGALQITGLALAVLGIPTRQVLVPDDDRDSPNHRRRDDDRDRDRSKLPPIEWSVAPFAPGADVGLSFIVRN